MLLNFQQPMRFDAFMHKALYDPQHGYYAQGMGIFGAQGDFITAPELSPLFGQTLGKALLPLLPDCNNRIYEFGAGTGQLACDVLSACGHAVSEYCIVDVSGGLKATQAERIERLCPAILANKVKWLDTLPEQLHGLVLANEVLDATPVRRFKMEQHSVLEAWVVLRNDTLEWEWRNADSALHAQVQHLATRYGPWPTGYTSEIAEQSCGLVKTITERLRGVAVMIDYGYQGALYYHPSRMQGTLRATRRHIAHDEILKHVGQQDLTAHVDFSAIYNAIDSAGGQLEGYVNQASFLLGHGILDLAHQDPDFLDPVQGAFKRQSLHTLLAESNMGEQFKVMVWSHGVRVDNDAFLAPLIQHDRSGDL